MIRRINFTGRKKILREDVRISVRPDADGFLTFDASVNLREYGLPDDGQVFIEAYRQTTLMRFPYGTVVAPQPARNLPLRLTEFTTRDGLLFRVKVSAAGDAAGVLLAEADHIPVSDDEEQPENRIALLPPFGQNLGQELWRVDFGSPDGPILLVNSSLGDWKTVAASPQFRSLVYPAAMRQVLWYVYKIEKTRHSDDPDDWGSNWLRFAAALPGAGKLPDDENDTEWEQWIDDAVGSFARLHRMLDHFKVFLDSEATT
jgi:hypothetical protein